MRSNRGDVDNKIHKIATLATDLEISIDITLSVTGEGELKGAGFDSVMRFITSLK